MADTSITLDPSAPGSVICSPWMLPPSSCLPSLGSPLCRSPDHWVCWDLHQKDAPLHLPPPRLPLPALATHFRRMSQDQVACPGSWPHWLQLTGVVPLFCRKKQLSLKKKRDPSELASGGCPCSITVLSLGFMPTPPALLPFVSISPFLLISVKPQGS